MRFGTSFTQSKFLDFIHVGVSGNAQIFSKCYMLSGHLLSMFPGSIMRLKKKIRHRGEASYTVAGSGFYRTAALWSETASRMATDFRVFGLLGFSENNS